MRVLLILVALVLAGSVHAQDAAVPDAHSTRPYVRLGGGGGILQSTHDYGVRMVDRNVGGWSGDAEAGLRRGTRTIGLRLSAARSRQGDAADLQRLLPNDRWSDVSAVTAVVVARDRIFEGPLGLQLHAGSGAGVGYEVARVQETPSRVTSTDGVVTGEVGLRREARVLPVFHLEAGIGRTIGRTYIGVGASRTSALVDARGEVVRYGLELALSL